MFKRVGVFAILILSIGMLLSTATITQIKPSNFVFAMTLSKPNSNTQKLTTGSGSGLSEGPLAIKKKSQSLISIGFSGILDPGTPEPALTKNKDGYYQFFDSGKYGIWWSKETGAHEVHGEILAKWRELGFETGFGLGYPISDQKEFSDIPGTRYNQFQGGVLAWTQIDDVTSYYPTLDIAHSTCGTKMFRIGK